MRAPAIAIFCIATALQGETTQRKTVAQLEQFLSTAKDTPDADVARELSAIELTERVSLTQAHELDAMCGGNECRNALMAMADRSVFYEAPEGESSAGDAPAESEQREIMAKFLTFVGRLNHEMPNFIATETTARFEDWPQGLQIGEEVAAREIPLQFFGKTSATITYRNEKEVVDPNAVKSRKRQGPHDQGLTTWGLFGPILTTVIADASRSKLEWGRWEHSATGRLAVFRFAVPMSRSTYEVKFCCVPVGGTLMRPLDRVTAYHGELAVNPQDGTIAHITLIADLDEGDFYTMLQESTEGAPLQTADLAVEYGPAEIGGKIYICPIRAVAFSRARTVLTKNSTSHLGPARTYLDDISFTGYHVFRSESRIITDVAE
jgi:hypothetical protein